MGISGALSLNSFIETRVKRQNSQGTIYSLIIEVENSSCKAMLLCVCVVQCSRWSVYCLCVLVGVCGCCCSARFWSSSSVRCVCVSLVV